MSLFRIYSIGLLISLLGSLPLGTLNVTAMQLAVNDGVIPAIYFSLGALLVEIAYVRISLVGIVWVGKQKMVFRWLEWFGVVIVMVLAIGSFISAAAPSGSKPVFLENDIPRILLGMGMSAINPMQIPFWFGWSTVLLSKKILLPANLYYNYYLAGIGTGTFLGHLIFIFAGTILMEKLRSGQQLLNWVIGGVFAATALILLIRIIFRKGPVIKP